MQISRRLLMKYSIATLATTVTPALGQNLPSIHVIKGKGCGCCTAWTEVLKNELFTVTSEELHPAALIQLKSKKGVPQELFSCHTAEINGYIIEGHVPAADIRRLISERPDCIGIGVAGMPYGSPGMGPDEDREEYEVVMFKNDGSTEIFNLYKAKS